MSDERALIANAIRDCPGSVGFSYEEWCGQAADAVITALRTERKEPSHVDVLAARMGAKWVERKEPASELDNHHNAATCPHCTDNGRFVLVAADALASRDAALALAVTLLSEVDPVNGNGTNWFAARDAFLTKHRNTEEGGEG